jgi:hypothetical protein
MSTPAPTSSNVAFRAPFDREALQAYVDEVVPRACQATT